MPEIYDYDDESGDFEIQNDSEKDVVYIRDGLIEF